IREYDEGILRNLEEVNAQRILSRPQFDLYRVTRADVLAAARTGVPDTQFIDFGSHTAVRHKLVGWSIQRWDSESMLAYSTLNGHYVCPWWGKAWCRTVLTKRGLE